MIVCCAFEQQDTGLTTWNDLLFDLQTIGHTGVTVWCHTATRPQGAIRSETTVDKYEIQRQVADDQQWAFKWKDVDELEADAENCANLFTAEQLEVSAAVGTLGIGHELCVED